MRQACIGLRHRHQQLFTNFEGEDNEDSTLQRNHNLQTAKAPPKSQAPVSTGILPLSLPEWSFRVDLGFCGFEFALKLPESPELLNTNLVTVRAKLGQTSYCPNGPQIWFPAGASAQRA